MYHLLYMCAFFSRNDFLSISHLHVIQNQQYHYRTGDHGFSLAISASLCVFFFCWWIGLACTIPAISIAVNVSAK